MPGARALPLPVLSFEDVEGPLGTANSFEFQEKVSFLLSTFKIFRQDDSFQAKEEAGGSETVEEHLLQQSRQVCGTSALGASF